MPHTGPLVPDESLPIWGKCLLPDGTTSRFLYTVQMDDGLHAHPKVVGYVLQFLMWSDDGLGIALTSLN